MYVLCFQDYSSDETDGKIQKSSKLKPKKNAIPTKCHRKRLRDSIVGPETKNQSFVVQHDPSTVPYSDKTNQVTCTRKRKKFSLDSLLSGSPIYGDNSHKESVPDDTVRVKSEPLEPTNDETEEPVENVHFPENWLSCELRTEVKEEPSSPCIPDDIVRVKSESLEPTNDETEETVGNTMMNDIQDNEVNPTSKSRLAINAVPSIFPNCPSYVKSEFTNECSASRGKSATTEDKANEVTSRCKRKRKKFSLDSLVSCSPFCGDYSHKESLPVDTVRVKSESLEPTNDETEETIGNIHFSEKSLSYEFRTEIKEESSSTWYTLLSMVDLPVDTVRVKSEPLEPTDDETEETVGNIHFPEKCLPDDTVRVKSEPLEPTNDEIEETVGNIHFQEKWLSCELKTEIKEEPSSPTHKDYFCYRPSNRLVFNGDETKFELWRIKFLGYMRLQKLYNVMVPSADEKAPPTSEENSEAFAQLIQFLDDRSLSLIIRDAEEEGRQTLQILEEHYLGKGKPRIIVLYHELTSLSMDDTDSVTDYVIRAETEANSLKAAGEAVSDSLLVAMMVRNYVRKTTRGNWDESQMKAAIEAVRENKMSLRKAELVFSVPKDSLNRRVKGLLKSIPTDQPHKKLFSPVRNVLSEDQENVLAKYIQEMDLSFYGLFINEIQRVVFEFVERNHIKHPFNKEKKMAGRDFVEGFLKRQAKWTHFGSNYSPTPSCFNKRQDIEFDGVAVLFNKTLQTGSIPTEDRVIAVSPGVEPSPRERRQDHSNDEANGKNHKGGKLKLKNNAKPTKCQRKHLLRNSKCTVVGPETRNKSFVVRHDPSTVPYSNSCFLSIRSDSNGTRAGQQSSQLLNKRCLKKDAIPTIFSNCPGYMNKEETLRKSNATSGNRLMNENKMMEQQIEQFWDNDSIKSIDDILCALKNDKSVPSGFNYTTIDGCLLLLHVKVFENIPELVASISVKNDMTISAAVRSEVLALNYFKEFLTPDNKLVLISALFNVMAVVKTKASMNKPCDTPEVLMDEAKQSIQKCIEIVTDVTQVNDKANEVTSRCKRKRKKFSLDSPVSCSPFYGDNSHKESLPVDTVRVESEPLRPTNDETEETVGNIHFPEKWLSCELRTEINEESSSTCIPDNTVRVKSEPLEPTNDETEETVGSIHFQEKWLSCELKTEIKEEPSSPTHKDYFCFSTSFRTTENETITDSEIPFESIQTTNASETNITLNESTTEDTQHFVQNETIILFELIQTTNASETNITLNETTTEDTLNFVQNETLETEETAHLETNQTTKETSTSTIQEFLRTRKPLNFSAEENSTSTASEKIPASLVKDKTMTTISVLKKHVNSTVSSIDKTAHLETNQTTKETSTSTIQEFLRTRKPLNFSAEENSTSTASEKIPASLGKDKTMITISVLKKHVNSTVSSIDETAHLERNQTTKETSTSTIQEFLKARKPLNFSAEENSTSTASEKIPASLVKDKTMITISVLKKHVNSTVFSIDETAHLKTNQTTKETSTSTIQEFLKTRKPLNFSAEENSTSTASEKIPASLVKDKTMTTISVLKKHVNSTVSSIDKAAHLETNQTTKETSTSTIQEFLRTRKPLNFSAEENFTSTASEKIPASLGKDKTMITISVLKKHVNSTVSSIDETAHLETNQTTKETSTSTIQEFLKTRKPLNFLAEENSTSTASEKIPASLVKDKTMTTISVLEKHVNSTVSSIDETAHLETNQTTKETSTSTIQEFLKTRKPLNFLAEENSTSTASEKIPASLVKDKTMTTISVLEKHVNSTVSSIDETTMSIETSQSEKTLITGTAASLKHTKKQTIVECSPKIICGWKWPRTPANTLANISCPKGSGNITLKCEKSGQFNKSGLDMSDCCSISSCLHRDLIKVTKSETEVEKTKLLNNITANLTNVSGKDMYNIVDSLKYVYQPTHGSSLILVTHLQNISEVFSNVMDTANNMLAPSCTKLWENMAKPVKRSVASKLLKQMDRIANFTASHSSISAEWTKKTVEFKLFLFKEFNKVDTSRCKVTYVHSKYGDITAEILSKDDTINGIGSTFTTIQDYLCFENTSSIGFWDSSGCTVNHKLSTCNYTVCNCNHLTNFAVLMDTEDKATRKCSIPAASISQNQTEKLDMKELLRYPLMPVPSSIGTPDGFLLQTDKSKAFSHLTKGITDAVPPPDHATLNIEDGNATFYCMTDVPTSFKQIGEKLVDMSTGGKSKVVFSTDMYKDDSIKSMERRSRGCGEKRIIQGENTRRPENWKEFLSNDDNKQQLIALLLKIWSSPECSRKLQKKEVIAICEGKAYLLTSDGKTVEKSEILTLESDQEETDTRVVLYCSFAEQEKDQFVRVRSPDSDIFFILLYYASNFNIRILFDTGSGNRRRLLDVTGMSKDFTPMYCAALLGLHAFTRCDTTSAFKGIGKVKPLKLLQQKPRYQEVFQSLGTTWRIPNELYQGLEEFTCNMYKRTTKSSAVNELLYEMIGLKCGKQTGLEIKLERKVDLSSLPPPRSCLNEHIRRVIYQVGIWKRAHIPKPIIPEAMDDHGWVKRNCQIEPKWSAGDVIPPKLADVLEKMECDDDDEG
ncbi:hypothetical protein GQR58_011609 [Nymphon striatum]|nr:hypothetical protein GQR58_011609 [Nymphon striatum]